jgi:HK97 family phage major capsid protein
MKSKALREQRAKLVADARALINAVPAGETMPAETEAKFDEMMAAADKLKAEIDRVERLEGMEAHLGQTIERRAGYDNISVDEARARADEDRAVFHAYLRHGLSAMPADLRQRAESRMVSIGADAVGRFLNAQSTNSDTAGGYLVPEGFDAMLNKAELAYSGMLEVANIMETDAGNDINWPTVNDTTNKGRILGENTPVTTTGVNFGTVKIGAYTFSSDLVLVSNELLQDSGVDLDALLTELLAERIGRKANEVFTIGSGASVPKGCLTASSLGVTAASATAVTADEVFFDLPHSVGRAYRRNARLMLNDATLKAISKLKDGEGRYLWQTSLAAGKPDTIANHDYTVNDDMPDIATGAKPIMFGDFSKYRIRRVRGARVLRLSERYADYNQTAFLAFQRMDGQLIDAGTNPVKHLLMA